MVVGFSIFMSMLVSFTLTPMLCSRFIRFRAAHRSSKGGWFWRGIAGGYGGILAWSLRHRWAIVLLAVATFAATFPLFRLVGKDFIPRDDQSEFEVAVTLPEGYSLERADAVFSELEARLQRLRGVIHTLATIGDTTGRVTKGQGDVTAGTIYVRLVDLRERKYTQFEVMNDARRILADYPDLRAAVQDVSAFQGTGFRLVMIDLNLRGPDVEKLQRYSEDITSWMREQGHYVDVDTSLSLRKPELRVLPDRERASELGVSIQTLAATANVLVGGEPVSKYKEFDEQYDVWLRAERGSRTDWQTISRLTVPSTKEGVGVVRLGNVAHFENALGPNTMDRFSRQRQVVISANLDNKPLGDAVGELTARVRSMSLPADYHFEFIGRAKTLAEATTAFVVAFALSFLFMYMILAAQFESFLHPITILLSLPLTIPFAFLSLILLRTNLDIYAMCSSAS